MQILKTYRYTQWCTTNFARSKVIIVDKKDPPLINEEIKCKIEISKQGISTIFIKREKNNWFWNCGVRSSRMVRNDKNGKENYFYDLSLKLNNSQTSPIKLLEKLVAPTEVEFFSKPVSLWTNSATWLLRSHITMNRWYLFFF